MKTIVSSRNPDLARDFARDLLRRRDLRLVVAATSRDLLARLREGADLCFVDRVLPDGDGARVVAAIRSDKKLAALPVVLVVGAGAPVPAPAELRLAGFSDAIALPARPGSLPLLVARLLGVPLRDNDRVAVRVHVHARPVDDARARHAFLGTSVDLSSMGMLVKASHAIPVGARLDLRFTLPGRDAPLAAAATVARLDERSLAPQVGVGVNFDSLSDADRRALEDYLGELLGGWPFRWQLLDGNAGRHALALAGALGAGADTRALETAVAALDGELDVRLRDLRRIGEDSVERWLGLVRAMKRVPRLHLRECPVAFVRQANRVPRVLERAEVESFYAPYACPSCGLEDEKLVEAGALDARTPPRFDCAGCGKPMLFDELPDRFFAFLDRN